MQVFSSIFIFKTTWSKHAMSFTSSRALDAILKRGLLNQHLLAPKFDFESFIEAEHLLRSWSNIWNLLNTKSLVT